MALLCDDIFKGCDIRGRYPRDLDETTFRVLGRAVGRVVNGQSVVVGGDVRLSTGVLKSALVRGLAETGAAVTDLGVAPTPAVYFAKRQTGARALCVVTASHNPPSDNGLKVMIDDEPATDEFIRRLAELARGEEWGEKWGKSLFSAGAEDGTKTVTAPVFESAAVPLVPRYVDWLVERFSSLAGRRPGLRVGVDAGNGCMGEPAPAVLRRLGFEVVELFCRPDGTFPNRQPNPAVAANLRPLCRCVVENACDLGVAYDGDGDRLAIVAEDGRAFAPEEAAVAFVRHMGVTAGDTVVYDIKSSVIVPREVERLGGRALVEKSGHSYIKKRMIAEDALWGCEISGHYFFRELGGADDALFATCVFLGILVGWGRKASELRDSVPRRFTTPDIRVEAKPGEWEDLVARAERSFPPERVSRLDGIRVEFDDGWALTRPSITEPKITFRFEGDSQEALREVVRRFCGGIGPLGTQVEQEFR